MALWKDFHLVPRGSPSWWKPGSPHLGHVLQQADVDGDQAWEALVGKTQAFHEEHQLRRAARVLDHVVELPPAQDVDVTLAEKRVWREKGQRQVPAPARGVSVGWGTRSRKCHQKGLGLVIVPAPLCARHVALSQITSVASGFLVYKTGQPQGWPG